MFNFINILYKNNKITSERVRSYCPKWINEEEVKKILE